MEEKDEALCSLYGSECRFVRFRNMTGRPIRVSSRLQLLHLGHQAWCSSRLLLPGAVATWRFLGEDTGQPELSSLSILPDPYTLSRTNSYTWTAAFLDSTDQEQPRFGDKPGTLSLKALRELGPGEEEEVVVRRRGMVGLATLCRDTLVVADGEAARVAEKVQNLQPSDLPNSLKKELLTLLR